MGAIPQNKEILLVDVPRVISDLGDLRKSQTLSEINNLRNDTEPLIDDLIQIGNMLEKDSLNVDNLDKHLAIIVVRGKKQVIDVIKKDVALLPKISSFDDATQLNTVLTQTLKKVGDVLGRQTRIIHIFAKKYAAQLKENLEVMNSNHSEIRTLLKNYDSTKSLSDQILYTLDQIKDLNDLHKVKSQKISETNKNTVLIQEKISMIKCSIDETKSSDSYGRYLALRDTCDKFRDQKSLIINQIHTQFTKISRPLSRYKYASSLDKAQKNLLSDLVAEPFDVLTSENRDSIITILENVRKGVSSGSISVKDIDKTTLQITQTTEFIDVFLRQISEYHTKYKELRDNVRSLKPENLDSLESALAKNITLADESRLKSATLQDAINEIDSGIPKTVSEIEEKLHEFSNTRYTVLLS